jgi:hypothetical protein
MIGIGRDVVAVMACGFGSHAQAEHRHVPGLLRVLPGRQLVGEQGGVLRSIRLLGRLAHGDGAVIQRISGRFLNLGILVGN